MGNWYEKLTVYMVILYSHLRKQGGQADNALKWIIIKILESGVPHHLPHNIFCMTPFIFLHRLTGFFYKLAMGKLFHSSESVSLSIK